GHGARAGPQGSACPEVRHWGDGHGVGALPGVYRRSADRSPAFIEAVSHTDDERMSLCCP
ncbi:MAG: hypothetical protein ACO281_09725, partial [Burkholderiaceae bacterium]